MLLLQITESPLPISAYLSESPIECSIFQAIIETLGCDM